MRNKRLYLLMVLALAVVLMGTGCATKKFVRQEITASETKLSQKMDQEHGKIANQINELSNLNKQLNSRVEQLADRVSTVDGKAEQAKTIGNEAKAMVNTVNTAVVELRSKFDARNNYVVSDTKTVYFDFNKSILTADATAVLDEIARLVAGNKNALITLEGYTDGVGSDQYNDTLSEKRANAVIRYLVGAKSVDLNRIYVVGLGKTNPVADNKTADGRKQNRRVVIKILQVR